MTAVLGWAAAAAGVDLNGNFIVKTHKLKFVTVKLTHHDAAHCNNVVYVRDMF